MIGDGCRISGCSRFGAVHDMRDGRNYRLPFGVVVAKFRSTVFQAGETREKGFSLDAATTSFNKLMSSLAPKRNFWHTALVCVSSAAIPKQIEPNFARRRRYRNSHRRIIIIILLFHDGVTPIRMINKCDRTGTSQKQLDGN